jgi:hypothetical protein
MGWGEEGKERIKILGMSCVVRVCGVCMYMCALTSQYPAGRRLLLMPSSTATSENPGARRGQKM